MVGDHATTGGRRPCHNRVTMPQRGPLLAGVGRRRVHFRPCGSVAKTLVPRGEPLSPDKAEGLHVFLPALSHRGGKSGQEAMWPSRKLRHHKNIRPKTLLATGLLKWPGGQVSAS